MSNNNWFIESISLTKATALPTKEEMEKLVLSSWPEGWEVIKKNTSDGMITVKIGHRSPAPKHLDRPSMKMITVGDYSTDGTTGIETSSYDLIADLAVGFVQDKAILNYSQSQIQAHSDLIKAREVLEKAKGKISAEEVGDLEELFKTISKAVSKIIEMKYLGEKGRGMRAVDGKKVIMSVQIGNFSVWGSLLQIAQSLEPGNTPIHSVACQTARKNHTKPGPSVIASRGGRIVKHINPTCQCKYCKSHPECSTLKAEDFIHREKVESLLLDIFARIKGKGKEQVKKVSAEIIRGQNKIKNLKEKSRIETGDTIKTDKTTQVNLVDGAGKKISIGSKTEVKINSPTDFELIIGSITAFIKKLKPKSKFDLRIPSLGTNSVRGTIFSVWTDKITMTLNVIEGEVEFSDLKGNKTIVKTNQICTYSKEQGLQKPVALPVNLKKQFKEKI